VVPARFERVPDARPVDFPKLKKAGSPSHPICGDGARLAED